MKERYSAQRRSGGGGGSSCLNKTAQTYNGFRQFLSFLLFLSSSTIITEIAMWYT
jgi:hypothetical protein